MPNLVTEDEFKASKGEATGTPTNAVYVAAIAAASTFILNYTDRDFASAEVTEDRTFLYDGSGILEIDDCSAINSVAFASGSPISVELFSAMPHRGPVFTWLELPMFGRRIDSGAMGFTHNLDVFFREHGPTSSDVLTTINADWGWPDVPADVKAATNLIAAEFASDTDEGGGALTSESIAEVARSWAAESTRDESVPVPKLALVILDMYKRWSL